MKEIEKAEIQGITPNGYSDLTGKDGCYFEITCRAKTVYKKY